MLPSATSAECPRQVSGGLGNDLMRIAPENLALLQGRNRPYRQAAFLDQPCTVAGTADCFPGTRIEPADAPDRIAAPEMPANPTGNGQVLVEPVELVLQLAVNPIGAAVPVQIPGRPEKAGLHPAFRMDQRRYKPHIHDDTHGTRRRRVPLAQIRDVECRPSAALVQCRRETSCEMHVHAFHLRLQRVSLKNERRMLSKTRDVRGRADTPLPPRHQGA